MQCLSFIMINWLDVLWGVLSVFLHLSKSKNTILSELYKGSCALKPPLHLVTNKEDIFFHQQKEHM